jgi:hypothetical protein
MHGEVGWFAISGTSCFDVILISVLLFTAVALQNDGLLHSIQGLEFRTITDCFQSETENNSSYVMKQVSVSQFSSETVVLQILRAVCVIYTTLYTLLGSCYLQ